VRSLACRPRSPFKNGGRVGASRSGVPAEASLLGLSGAAAKALMDQFAQEEAEARRKVSRPPSAAAVRPPPSRALLVRAR
jgi:hypothetical protein